MAAHSYWPIHSPPVPGEEIPGRDLHNPLDARRCTVQLSTGRLYLDAVASPETALLGHDIPSIQDTDETFVARLLSSLAPGYFCLAMKSTFAAAAELALSLNASIAGARARKIVQVNAVVGEPDVTCDVLVVHENETLGRSGQWVASSAWKRLPDFVVAGDALALGLPFGAVLGRNPRASISEGEADPKALAHVAAAIRAVEEQGLLQQGREVADYLFARLASVRETCPEIESIEGLGLSIRVVLAPPVTPTQIRRRMCERGVLVGIDAAGHLAIDPPLPLRIAEVDVVIGALRGALLDLPMVSASPCCPACE